MIEGDGFILGFVLCLTLAFFPITALGLWIVSHEERPHDDL